MLFTDWNARVRACLAAAFWRPEVFTLSAANGVKSTPLYAGTRAFQSKAFRLTTGLFRQPQSILFEFIHYLNRRNRITLVVL